MGAADPERRTAVSRLLFGLSIAAAATAVLVVVTGGFTTRILGVRVSAHGAVRPTLLALLAAFLSLRLLPVARQQEILARGRRVGDSLPIVAIAAAAVVLALGVMFGSRTAGGSDTYGYVSEAQLWLAGNLHVTQAFAADVPWPNADWTFTPLGYRPAAGHTMVPTYAPGLPLLMVVLGKAAGRCGPYLVTPLCGAALVLLTYGLGVRASGRVTGAIAALSMASSPTVLFMSMWPMSDVPAAAFWTAALLIASWPSATAAAASGVAAGIAITIRPNLAPLAVFPVLIAVLPAIRVDARRALRTGAAFAAACLPFVLFIAWLNNDLYGSAFESGYGETGAIFSAAHFTANLSHYPRWLWETQGPLIALFPFAVLIPGAGPSVVVRRVLLGFIVAVFGCYLWYVPFNGWWFLRFVLPAFPAIFVLCADVVWRGMRRFGPHARVAAAVLFTLVVVDTGMTEARKRASFEIRAGEQKYADVGLYVARQLPENAIVFTLQHSGSVRYYSGRRTIRWEWLEADWLDRAIAHLRASGLEPYLILEQWEVPAFRQRFASQASLAFLDRPPLAAHSRGVYVYGTGATPAGTAAEPIPETHGCQ